MAGLNPQSAIEVNSSVGNALRIFIDSKESIGHIRESLAPLDLKVEPYMMDAADETLIKSAINGLDDALDAIDMTFINRLVGMW